MHSTCKSFLNLYILEIYKSSLSSFSSQSLLSAVCPHSKAQGWAFIESFAWCNKLPTSIRYIINIIMLAYKNLHALKTCFPNKAETQSLRELLSPLPVQSSKAGRLSSWLALTPEHLSQGSSQSHGPRIKRWPSNRAQWLLLHRRLSEILIVNPNAALKNPMAKTSHLPISNFGHIHKLGFFPSSPH